MEDAELCGVTENSDSSEPIDPEFLTVDITHQARQNSKLLPQ